MKPPLSIIIADDDTVFPFGLNVWLKQLNPQHKVQIAQHGQQAIDLLAREKSDLVFMDYLMPVMGGLQATEIIMRDFPQTKIIMCSEHIAKEIIFQMLELEVHGYMYKSSKRNEVENAVEKVMRGEHYYSDEITELIKEAAIASLPSRQPAELGNKHTTTETIILILVCKGYQNKEIAAMRNVDVRTVETHRHNINTKIGAKTHRDIFRYAIANKIIDSLDFFTTE